IVQPEHRAKALGLIYMGVSSSLVLGVPIGIMITDAFGWRSVFLGIAFLSVLSIILIYLFIERISPDIVKPLSEQIKALCNFQIVLAYLAAVFLLAVHFILYAYL